VAKTRERLRSIFGSRIAWLGSGGAPLPVPVAQAYLDAGFPVLQGYGLTESSPVITFNRAEHFKIETVGQPIPGVEVAIAPDGEVLTRGPHVMKGYWNNPAATAEAIRDGWLYTGDLGRLDEQRFLTITGRKKDLLVLSSGKKLVPTWIEGLLLAELCIDQVVVYGEGRNYLTALIVPNWDHVRKALATSGTRLEQEPTERLVNEQQVLALIQKRIDHALREVSSWEKVKRFRLLPQPFTVAGEELTVSLKLRRGVVFEKYRTELEQLYGETGVCHT
jgi:long-chain acyl-CoA synthetase